MFIEENQNVWKFVSYVYDFCKYDNLLKRYLYIGVINVKYKIFDFFQFKFIYDKFVIIILMYDLEIIIED